MPVLWRGLLYTSISTHLTAAEVEYIVNDCEAKIIITSAQMKEIAREILKGIPRAEIRLSVGGGHRRLPAVSGGGCRLSINACP